MKGTNKNVIEIIEPQNEYIEKVLVFMRKTTDDVKVEKQSSLAHQYAGSLICWKKQNKDYNAVFYIYLAMAALIGVAIGAYLVQLFT